MDFLIRCRDVTKSIQDKVLFENTTFDIVNGDCIGFIGSNGTGKTTMFKMLMGLVGIDSGEIWKKDRLRIRLLEQVASESSDMTVYTYFNTDPSDSVHQKISKLEERLTDPTIYETGEFEDIMSKINDLRKSAGKAHSDKKMEQAIDLLDELGMGTVSPKTNLKTLSGGERQKLALAKVLSTPEECDLLLLDEPTNHLDIDSIEWLERKLADYPGSIIIVSHDRYLLDDLVDRMFDIQNRKIKVFESNYEGYLEQNEIYQNTMRQAYNKAMKEERRQQKVIRVMTRRNKYDQQVKSKINRLKKLKPPKNPVIEQYLLKMHFKNVFKSGKNIADGKGITKKFGERTILEESKFEIMSGEKIGLIGANGCGKTTFLKILTGEMKADAGTINLSQGVRWGYFDQAHLSLKPENTLVEEVLRNQDGLKENDAKALLGQFNFKGAHVFKTVNKISGGERARLSFLRLLMQPYNFLILDEPTNHLDIESRLAMESALNTFQGTVIVVSHDRHFLDNVVDKIILLENETLYEYAGNYSQYREQRDKEGVKKEEKGVRWYQATKKFTEWVSGTRHELGEFVVITKHNEDNYKWAIDTGALKRVEN